MDELLALEVQEKVVHEPERDAQVHGELIPGGPAPGEEGLQDELLEELGTHAQILEGCRDPGAVLFLRHDFPRRSMARKGDGRGRADPLRVRSAWSPFLSAHAVSHSRLSPTRVPVASMVPTGTSRA
jgi:hypothetical protein